MVGTAFQVGQVLPATTQLRIYFDGAGAFNRPTIQSDGGAFGFFVANGLYYAFNERSSVVGVGENIHWIYDYVSLMIWVPPYNSTTHNYIDINTSTWTEEKRTISTVDSIGSNYSWEDIAFFITYEENGGTEQTDLMRQKTLPGTLPVPTKAGYTFVAWYTDSTFTTRAVPGAVISADTTLYARWLDIAGAISVLETVMAALKTSINNKGGAITTEGLIDYASVIDSLTTYQVVDTIAEMQALPLVYDSVVYVNEAGDLPGGEPLAITQTGDELIIG